MLVILLVLLAVFIGVLAGVYPAFFLSSFKPVAVLGGKPSHGMKRSLLRNGLVVFQFSLSVLLLTSTLVVRKQMDFIRTRNLGYDQEQTIVLQTYGEVGQKLQVLKDALLADPSITAVSASTSVPGSGFTNIGMDLEGNDSSTGTNLFVADADYLNAMGMEMAEGRYFDDAIPTDRQAVVLNESMARGFDEKELLGKRMRIWAGGEGMELFPIIGIVKDFHYESFHEPVKPMVIVKLYGTFPWSESYVSIRVNTTDMRAALGRVRETWESILPGMPFEYTFLDALYDAQYRNEERTGRVFTIFTLLAIFVACLGLVGLASFAAEQRTKEIGIRKVLGADMVRIVLMLSRDFQKLILIANVIGWPIAYFMMRQWLQSFAYRTTVGLWVFVVSGVLAVLIAQSAILYHARRAAATNPVKSLKHE
jgi:putative ABC transport system permease protein